MASTVLWVSTKDHSSTWMIHKLLWAHQLTMNQRQWLPNEKPTKSPEKPWTTMKNHLKSITIQLQTLAVSLSILASGVGTVSPRKGNTSRLERPSNWSGNVGNPRNSRMKPGKHVQQTPPKVRNQHVYGCSFTCTCTSFLSPSTALKITRRVTFSGFKSRYMMARAWRYSKARVMEPPKNLGAQWSGAEGPSGILTNSLASQVMECDGHEIDADCCKLDQCILWWDSIAS